MSFFAVLYNRLREEAFLHGYTLTLHGSLSRDLDVVAIPWTEDAVDEETFIKAIVEESGGVLLDENATPTQKPHGRKAYIITLMGVDAGYIDLSLMPKKGGDVKCSKNRR